MEPYRPSKYSGSGILFEFYYLVESNFRAIAMSSCIETGGAFSENYNLTRHTIIGEGKGTCIIFLFKSEFSHTLRS